MVLAGWFYPSFANSFTLCRFREEKPQKKDCGKKAASMRCAVLCFLPGLAKRMPKSFNPNKAPKPISSYRAMRR